MSVPPKAFEADIEISCADGSGMSISKVASFIASQGLSLSSLETLREPVLFSAPSRPPPSAPDRARPQAPHGGATLFSLKGHMCSPESVDEDRLHAGFQDLEADLGITIDYSRGDD